MSGTQKAAAVRAECQICEGTFSTKNGLLVKHGYKRPGDGFLHGECMGVGHAPFPATDALEAYRGMISTMLSDHFARLNELERGVETVLHVQASALRPLELKEIAIGVTERHTWETELRTACWRARGRVRDLVREVARVEARLVRAAALRVAS